LTRFPLKERTLLLRTKRRRQHGQRVRTEDRNTLSILVPMFLYPEHSFDVFLPNIGNFQVVIHNTDNTNYMLLAIHLLPEGRSFPAHFS